LRKKRLLEVRRHHRREAMGGCLRVTRADGGCSPRQDGVANGAVLARTFRDLTFRTVFQNCFP
jgi:hypothetical protein